MKFNKRIFNAAISVLLVASLAACEKGGKDPVDPNPVEPDEPVQVVVNDIPDGEVLIDDQFEDGDEFVWGTYTNGGSFTLSQENGEMVADITNTGSLDYACQIFRDGYELNQDAVYALSFDIRSDIERNFEFRFQINGSDYHAYYKEYDVPIGPETRTITSQFTMEEASDPAPRFCFNLGLFEGMDASVAHKVYIDNFKLVVTDKSNAKEIEGLGKAVSLKVNQLGYKCNSVKKVVATTSEKLTTFDVCDASTGEVVFTGDFESEYTMSNSGDGKTVTGDFTAFKTPGKYYIKADGIEDKSYEFEINDKVYDSVTKDTVRMLYLQRCGCEVKELADTDKDYTHGECHTGKAKIYGTNDYIDVSGGWHDAGDYGRYTVAGAKTIADLLMTYEDNKDARGDDYGIPESGNKVPDILDEARYELEFLLKMQADNGGVYHKVTCAVFPGNVMPEEETDELIVCPISTTATGDFAAVMAKAGVIYKSIDSEFAAKCLEASKKAYEYMEANAENDKVGFKNPSDIATGEYPDEFNTDEYVWAAVELYLATGDSKYLEKTRALTEVGFKGGLGWADMGYYPAYDYLKAKGFYKATGKEGDGKSLSDNDYVRMKFSEKLSVNAEGALDTSKSDSYFSPMYTYPWGSNMTIGNTGILYRMMYNLTKDEKYNEYALHMLDYILGINPTGYSYITGYGTLYPENPHHRPSQYNKKAVKGMIVGGPNSNPEDPIASIILKDKLHGSAYCDNDGAYSINEVAIYWNSPFIYLFETYR